ncbi:MAG: glycosyltransferase family 4 protein [Ginsengibacter sp.]
MNIVYISKYTVLPEFGSPTRQYFLSKYLSKLPDNNVLSIGSRSSLGNIPRISGLYHSNQVGNLTTVTLNGPNISLGFNLKRLWSWILFEFNIFRFRKHIRSFKPDVVIVSSLSILTFISGVFLKRWLNIPLVVEVRDLYPLTLQEIGNFSSRNPLIICLRWIEKLGYKHADLIISSLPNAKEHISKVLKRPFEFLWLPMGIDLDYYNKEDDVTISDLFEKKTGEFVVGYAGTMGRSNALDGIFNAARTLSNIHPNIKFVFVGDGPLKSIFQEKYNDLTNVTFIPPVPKASLPRVLEKTDVLINTWLNRPIYRFGVSPNKWIDYMYASKPILVAYSGYKCIIEEAECGMFVPAEDTNALIEGIVKFSKMSPVELNQIGNNGKEYLLKNLSYESLAGIFFQRLKTLKSKRISHNQAMKYLVK